MGRNKLLLELHGESVLQRAVKSAAAAELDPIIVVLGHEREQAEKEFADLSCVLAYNAEHEAGTHISIRVGIEQVPERAAAVVVMLADMPLVTAEMLRELVRCYRRGEARLVVSRYGGEINAPPTLYDRALFPELRVMTRRCAKEVIQRHRETALHVDWPESALADLDRIEDYEQVVSRLAAP